MERNQGELPGGEAAGVEAPLWPLPHALVQISEEEAYFCGCRNGVCVGRRVAGEAAIESRGVGRGRAGDKAGGRRCLVQGGGLRGRSLDFL